MIGEPFTAIASLGLCCRTKGYLGDKEVMRMVECPHCKHENDMSHALIDGLSSDNKFDWECTQCENEFEVFVEFEPCYSASKIEIINCGNCGKETRDIYEKGRVFPFPKLLADKRVCQICFCTSFSNDLD